MSHIEPTIEFVECLKCRKKSSTLISRGALHVYRLTNEILITAATTHAWCSQCDEVVLAERFPDMFSIDAEIARLEETFASLARNLNWKERILLQIPWSKKVKEMTNILRERDKFASLRRFYSERKSPCRCLACGSTDWVALTSLLERKDGAGAPLHPKCGGPLAYGVFPNRRNARISIFPSYRVYDNEGNFLGKMNGWPNAEQIRWPHNA